MAPQNIRAIYGIPPSLPSLTDSVLVLIDTQGEYADGLLKVEKAAETRAVIKGLLDRYRAAGPNSVVHVAQASREGAPVFTPGTPLADILPELTPTDSEPVVYKRHATAFTGTTFQQELDKIGKKKLVVVGYMAHNCVSATVRAAAELGYDVYAVRDAVGDRDLPGASAEELVRVSLIELADVVATIIDSKDVQ
ncbi:isochorismatase [Sporothrix brasiliensis 5110]|uniref:Isochorismatase n=1 Tax=Sporothrix brasiliensis 5110 TaxID=1398154 RepID=A0A0C2F7M9_9PEZI|nr:isochorismatase [Sporothrix brasiliensis 5110]KIH87063.1 isochorismatase [Sporothrix brasiliensis 5110]